MKNSITNDINNDFLCPLLNLNNKVINYKHPRYELFYINSMAEFVCGVYSYVDHHFLIKDPETGKQNTVIYSDSDVELVKNKRLARNFHMKPFILSQIKLDKEIFGKMQEWTYRCDAIETLFK